MKISVSKADLETAMQVSMITVGSSDMSGHIVFRQDDDGKIRLYTYNTRICSSVPLQTTTVEVEGITAFTLEAKRLKQLLSAAPNCPLVIECKNKIVTVTTSKGEQEFRSLDPAKFPFWDKKLAEATVTATVEPHRFAAAITHLKQYVSDDYANRPQFCVIEAKDAKLVALNSKALSVIPFSGLENSNLRFYSSSINNMLKFLSLCKDSVDVLESSSSGERQGSQSVFLRRKSDGALISEAKAIMGIPSVYFNTLSDSVAPAYSVTLVKDDIKSAITHLVAGADESDDRLRISWDDEKASTVFAMKSTTGKEKKCMVTTTSVEGTPTDKSFSIAYPDLLSVVASCHDATLKLDIVEKGPSGYLKHMKIHEGDTYHTWLIWLI